MPAYKDTDVILKKIESAFQVNWDVPCDAEDRIIQGAISKVYRIIRETPTVEVPQIVRCENCAFLFKREEYNLCTNPHNFVGKTALEVSARHFCGHGRRKDGEI